MYIISACLCGVNCKYNGLNNYNKECSELFQAGKAIIVCPEQLGGLTTPRIPSELTSSASDIIENRKNKVISKSGEDVTHNFIKGAEETIEIAKKINVELAILKEGSPSCGVNYVYDGTFNGNKIKGVGITTQMLIDMGIKVISENDLGGMVSEYI